MYVGAYMNWKQLTFEWQIGKLWGFHGRYFWIIRWTMPDETHKRIIGSKGYGTI